MPSCAMPMARDPEGGGLEKMVADQRNIALYVMVMGRFITRAMTSKIIKMVVNTMVENGWRRPVAWFFTREIPTLERWRKNH